MIVIDPTGGGSPKIEVTVTSDMDTTKLRGPTGTHHYQDWYGQGCATEDGMGNVVYLPGYASKGQSMSGFDSNIYKINSIGEISVLGQNPVTDSTNAFSCTRLGNSGDVIVARRSTSGGQVFKISPTGETTMLESLASSRTHFVCTTTRDGCAIFFGGVKGSTIDRTVDVYAPDGTHTSFTSPSSYAYKCGIVPDNTTDGAFIVIGGASSTDSMSTTSAVYKIFVNGSYTSMPNLVTGRNQISAAADGNGGFICGAGFLSSTWAVYVERYDNRGARVTFPDLSVARIFPHAARLPNGGVAFISGGALGQQVTNVDMYTVGGVKSLTYLTAGVYDFAARPTGDGCIHCIGGVSGNTSNYYMTLDQVISEGVHKKGVRIPANYTYKFQEHSDEQAAEPFERVVAVEAPNSGYIRPLKSSIVI